MAEQPRQGLRAPPHPRRIGNSRSPDNTHNMFETQPEPRVNLPATHVQSPPGSQPPALSPVREHNKSLERVQSPLTESQASVQSPAAEYGKSLEAMQSTVQAIKATIGRSSSPSQDSRRSPSSALQECLRESEQAMQRAAEGSSSSRSPAERATALLECLSNSQQALDRARTLEAAEHLVRQNPQILNMSPEQRREAMLGSIHKDALESMERPPRLPPGFLPPPRPPPTMQVVVGMCTLWMRVYSNFVYCRSGHASATDG